MRREIILPPIHNKRAPAQWEIIDRHVDFEGKSVLDLGCGYADILWRCYRAGAVLITGVDHNTEIINSNKAAKQKLIGAHQALINFYCMSISDFIDTAASQIVDDIIICFSILPYLDDVPATLRWIHNHSWQALIEYQTYGDGPGPEWHKTDDDMRRVLEHAGWTSVNRIGATHVAIRDKWRSIWLCENEETTK